MKKSALTKMRGTDNDYTLNKSFNSCWIIVGDISVYIKRDKQIKGVTVELYPLWMEMSDPPLDIAFCDFETAKNKRREK